MVWIAVVLLIGAIAYLAFAMYGMKQRLLRLAEVSNKQNTALGSMLSRVEELQRLQTEAQTTELTVPGAEPTDENSLWRINMDSRLKTAEDQYRATKLMTDNIQKQYDRIDSQHKLLYRQIVDIANAVIHDPTTAALQHIVGQKWGGHAQDVSLEAAIDDRKLEGFEKESTIKKLPE